MLETALLLKPAARACELFLTCLSFSPAPAPPQSELRTGTEKDKPKTSGVGVNRKAPAAKKGGLVKLGQAEGHPSWQVTARLKFQKEAFENPLKVGEASES